MTRFVEIPEGTKFGFLRVEGRGANNKFGQVCYWCVCVCGTNRLVPRSKLTSKKYGTRSCGCRGKGTTFRPRTPRIRKDWSEEELKILVEHYPIKGSRWVSNALGRSEGSVTGMATRKGVVGPPRAPRPYEWTDEEIQLLRTHYAAGGVNLAICYLHRMNKRQIQQKAAKLGIRAAEMVRRRSPKPVFTFLEAAE